MLETLPGELGIAPPVFWALMGTYSLLVLASIVVSLLERRDPGVHKELIARVKSWWLMITIFAFAVFVYQPLAAVFLGLLSYLALKEFFSIIPTRKIDRVVVLVAYLAVPVQFWLAYRAQFGEFMVFIPVWVFLLLPTIMALKGQTAGYLRSVGTLSWGLMMTVFTLSHMAYLLFSGDAANPVAGGRRVVILSRFHCSV